MFVHRLARCGGVFVVKAQRSVSSMGGELHLGEGAEVGESEAVEREGAKGELKREQARSFRCCDLRTEGRIIERSENSTSL